MNPKIISGFSWSLSSACLLFSYTKQFLCTEPTLINSFRFHLNFTAFDYWSSFEAEVRSKISMPWVNKTWQPIFLDTWEKKCKYRIIQLRIPWGIESFKFRKIFIKVPFTGVLKWSWFASSWLNEPLTSLMPPSNYQDHTRLIRLHPLHILIYFSSFYKSYLYLWINLRIN